MERGTRILIHYECRLCRNALLSSAQPQRHREGMMIENEIRVSISQIEMTPIPMHTPDAVERLHPITESPQSRGISEIEESLIAYGEVLKSRNTLLQEAKTAGISEARIAKLTGHSRNTVRSALAAG
ncbi:DUF6003 family protein [Streptomyces sp. NPDC047023]|uniref:DUF6003 family protein n=1 Tax=Streptomyces sp. NPDC047023 TaxID=3155139 RepID=UPI0033D2242B